MSMRTMKRVLGSGTLITALVTGVVVVLLTSGGAGAQRAADYPRNQTLYTGGTQWGNVNGYNPFNGQYATGQVGLVNETLLRYDPLKDKYIPWLATSAKFTSAKVFQVVVRSGVKWSDGTEFTAQDVAFTFNLGQFPAAFWHNLWQSLAGPATASGNTVTFTFKGTPDYQQWFNNVWNVPIVQKAQWKDVTNTNLVTFNADANATPIGTGPYVLDKAGTDPAVRVVWKKSPIEWWASKAGLIPEPKPNYVIDIVNSSNNVALGLVINGQEDLNNNYLPGISQLVGGGYGLSTYYDKAPYDLSANTAWLVPNVTRAPMNDAKFRQAMAYAINVDQIVKVDYGNLVLKSNATGLLPIWNKYVDNALVKQLGFKYDPAKAAQILTSAGYKKQGKWFVTPQGKPIKLTLIVPQGWSDWMQAINMIAADLQKVGINVTPAYPANFFTLRNAGTFDLAIDNSAQQSDTPWTYYNYMFNLPILRQQTFANFGRYTNKAAWNLADQLDKIPVGNTAAMNKVISQIQKITLTQLPIIPLWYNGVWAQFSDQVWTNWPSGNTTRQYMPAMWRGYLQMTGIDMIAHLKLK